MAASRWASINIPKLQGAHMGTDRLAELVSNTFIFLSLSAFFVLLYVEKKHPYRKFDKSTTKESVLTNLSAFFFNNVVLTLVRATSLFLVAQKFAGHGLLSGMTEGPFRWLVTFLLYDLAIYGWHVLNHHSEFFWRFHKVHHSDKSYNVTTGFRFHVFDLLIEIPFKCLFVILIGVDAHIVLAMEAIQLLFILFHHANVQIPSEIKLSKWIITPSLHRTHHSALRKEHDSNYGIVLAFWDRLFGTRLEAVPLSLGLEVIIAENFLQLFCLALITENHFRQILRIIPKKRPY
jgi:sterol desaturase/sphingolipid hydroxylase (fatty acid hydroxylase superfamily)